MPKTKISEFSATPANNTDIDSINIAEGCAPSGINDAIRELMAQLKDFQTGAQGDSFNGPIGSTTPAAGVFTTLSASSTATLSGLTASTALALDASKNIVSVTNTGTGSNVLATSPTLVTPALGTPSALVGTNITGTASGLTAGNVTTNANLTGAVTSVGNATSLGSFSSANLLGALTDETGTGSAVFATSPTLVTPILGTPTSATLTNATGLPIATGVSGLGTGIATALAVNTGSAGAPVLFNGALGTPSGGTLTSVTGLPLTTGVTGTLPTANGGTNLGGATPFTSGGVVYASSTSALATGSALTFDGTNFASTGIITSTNVNGLRAVYPSSASFYGQLDSRDGNTFLSAVGSTAAIVFRATNGASTTAEGMRLTSVGLGIGESAPAQSLHVKTATAATPITLGVLSNSTTLPALSFNGAYASTTMAGTYSLTGSLYTTVPSGAAQYFSIADAIKLTLDSSGNLGLGVTPSAWGGSYRALQVGQASSLYGIGANTIVGNNVYNDGTNTRYITSSFSSLYVQNSSGQHTWFNSPSGTAGNAITFTQAMTLSAAGNLGIGTTSPDSATRLDIEATNARVRVKATSTGSALYTTNNTGGTFYTGLDDSGGNTFGVGAYSGVVWNGANTPIVFATNNTERARITSGGFFKASNAGTYQSSTGSYHELVSNVADASAKIANTNASPYGLDILYTAASPNNTVNAFLYCADNVGQRVTIRSNGGIANYSANDVNLSDRREKTNFAPATSYLDKICAIPVQTFNYIDQNLEEDGGLTLGVVAQDVQAVAPELVMESNWGTEEAPKMRLSIYQTDLQYALMKCIQEQQAIIESLKARLDAANL